LTPVVAGAKIPLEISEGRRMTLANQLLLPQERFNIKYRPSQTDRCCCPTCSGRVIRSQLCLCSHCGRMGCPNCCSEKRDKKYGFLKDRTCSACRVEGAQ